jgi:hypothetical protein
LEKLEIKKIIALGNKAEACLRTIGIKTEKVRHPAMGGAELFREQFLKIVKG